MTDWKPVLDFEGLYEVSDDGQVRSLERMVPNGPGTYRVVNTRILRPGLNLKGYEIVNLSRARKNTMKTVHSLVLEAFVGRRPRGMWGLHANDIKRDNRLENLRWGTPAENTQDAKLNGRWTPPPISLPGRTWTKRSV